jgi:hypothetical protein
MPKRKFQAKQFYNIVTRTLGKDRPSGPPPRGPDFPTLCFLWPLVGLFTDCCCCCCCCCCCPVIGVVMDVVVEVLQPKLIKLFTFVMEEHTLKNYCLNTNIYSYLETSGGQSSNLY